MLTLAFSNRFEALQEFLIARIAEEVGGQGAPFAAPRIIIPSTAIKRVVEQTLADRYGICAEIRFGYLAEWLWQELGKVVPVPEVSPFTPAILAWRIQEQLGDARFIHPHPRLARYLAHADPVMVFDLARRIAQQLEHTITYRPAWLEAWAAGRPAGIPGLDAARAADEAWQADLWRRLVAELGTSHQHLAGTFARAQAAQAPTPTPGTRASREAAQAAHLFCLNTLPPLYLDILRQQARTHPIHLYVLNPSREFWSDIVDRKRQARLDIQEGSGPEFPLFDPGNPLLAAWGKQTREHIDLLVGEESEGRGGDSGIAPPEVNHIYLDPLQRHSPGLLHQIQARVLHLEDMAPGSLSLEDGDRSVEVHVCYSFTRELEVLQDQLLAAFADPGFNPPLQPDQVLIATPDLEGAAPLIDSVFGTAPPSRRLPYFITGRGQTRENPIARILDQLLQLAAAPVTAGRLYGLIEQEAVALRYGLMPESGDPGEHLERLRTWISEAGIRRGLGGEAPVRGGDPSQDDERHSVESGLNRLFLAYAWGDADQDQGYGPEAGYGAWDGSYTPAPLPCFAGFLGSANPEGGEALLLGRLARLTADLRNWRQTCGEDQSADRWRETLLAGLDCFVGSEGGPSRQWAEDLGAVRRAISQLHQHMVQGGQRTPQPLAVIHHALTDLLDDPARGGVPGGGLTFAALPNLRQLPYRMVCLIGLQDGAFPSTQRPAEFDLLALRPRPGDRQRRADERNLFLDLILAARDRLYLSYTGRNIRDASLLPASILVDELLDVLVPACTPQPEAAGARAHTRGRLVVDHPLQAFSPEYFLPPQNAHLNAHYDAHRDPRRVSFREDYAAALNEGAKARRRHPGQDRPPRFLPEDSPLPRPAGQAELLAGVELDEMKRFFRHPGRYFLRKVLGIEMPQADGALAEEEPFLPDSLAQGRLGLRLFPRLLGAQEQGAGAASDQEITALLRADMDYPEGPLGHLARNEDLDHLQRYARQMGQILAPTPTPASPTVAEVSGEDFPDTLAGLPGWPGDLATPWWVRGTVAGWRPMTGGDTGWYQVRLFLKTPGRYQWQDAWFDHLFANAQEEVAPGTQGVETRLYSPEGHARLMPLPPATARQHLAELVGLYRLGHRQVLRFYLWTAWTFMEENEDLYKAHQAWRGRKETFSDSRDETWSLLLRGDPNPLDRVFIRLARLILAPLLAHREELP